MNKLNKYLLTFSFLISSSLTSLASENNWITYHENSEVKITYQKQNCDYNNQFNQEFIIIKIDNLTSNAIFIEWDNKIWYDNNCVNCEHDYDELRKKIRLESNKTMVGNCFENNALRIFSKFTEKLEDMPGVKKITKLTKFELKNLKITYE